MLPWKDKLAKVWVDHINERRREKDAKARALLKEAPPVIRNELARNDVPKKVALAIAEHLMAANDNKPHSKLGKRRARRLALKERRRQVARREKVAWAFRNLNEWPRIPTRRHARNFDAHIKEPKTAFESGRAFVNYLVNRKGFQVLGEGYFSTVLWKKGDRVIKVNRGMLDGWLDYVLWSHEKGYAGKIAPKVFSWKIFNGTKGQFYVATMEKIEYTSRKYGRDKPGILIPTLLSHANDNPTAKEFVEKLSPGVTDFAKALREKFHSLDLHAGNWMYRADGSYVVTDPVSGHAETKTTRFKAAA